MDDALKKYRNLLIVAEQKAQDDFDKTVLTLSGGALGVTFAFIKDIIGSKPTINSEYIFYAWLAWGISVSAVLLSFYFSHLALREAIKQIDSGKVYGVRLGGWYDSITGILNAVGAILFVVGVIFAAIFAHLNL